MALELDTAVPSTRQLQKLVQDKQEVEIKLITNDLVVGKISWQDPYCVCVLDHYDQPTIIWRQAIVFVKPKA